MTKIYPDIEIKEVTQITLMTTLRKANEDGVYYKWKFRQEYIVPDNQDIEEAKSRSLHRFHTDVYLAILYAKIQPHVKDVFGSIIYEKDADQSPENERILGATFKLKKP